jgi:hypothetical protein
MNHRTFLIGLFLVCDICTATAKPAGPPAGYKIDPQYTQKSPDGAITVEQYVNKETDDWKYQFWVRRKDSFTLLDEQADYPAGFRFTNDLKWIVRMQKTGSGESSLYLYRLAPQGYVPATKKPLDELAWAYMKTRPELAKGREGAGVSHVGESLEGARRGELSLVGRRLASEPLSSHRPVG